MKRLHFIIVALLLSMAVYSQNAAQARKILDKTAAVVGRKEGASADFSISGKHANASGTISIKGNKFNARTSQAIVWYDGKTQWTYMKNSQEVNVSTPTEAQQQSMNPYKFINIYKNGFKLGMKNVSGGWQIHLYATNQKRTIKEMYKLTMENVNGFGTESRYYKEIGSCAADILLSVPELVSTVSKAKFSNKLLCLTELGSLVTETQQLVADFVNIVNNAKVQNPLKGQATAEKKDDGYNLLDRYERLTLANRIYTDLTKIRYKVEGMTLMAQFATANDLFFAIDPEGWADVVTMRNHVDGLINDWNGLVAVNY